VKNKTGLVVPPSVRRRAGIKPGDRLEFDEYTLEQRRIIDAGIAEGMEDFRKGRSHGPFTADEARTFLKSQMKRPHAKSVKRAK
jgi:bifunctional DNA-binding transcriptional regulator/antitoxin component of YhaV-PrlF toxin-antitoxin module